MGTDLASFVKVFDNICPAEDCQELIDTFDRYIDSRDVIENDGRPNFSQLNLATAVESGNEELVPIQNKLLNHFNTALSMYGKELPVQDFMFPPRYGYEQFRVKFYKNDGEDRFDLHTDVGDHNSARRFLAFFLYLNDVEVGGETVFPDFDLKVAPKAGSVLVFPPLWMWRHEGRRPVTNPKYIVGSYLHYL